MPERGEPMKTETDLPIQTVEDETEVDANNPSEIQRRRLEEQKKREEALKRLQQQGTQP